MSQHNDAKDEEQEQALTRAERDVMRAAVAYVHAVDRYTRVDREWDALRDAVDDLIAVRRKTT